MTDDLKHIGTEDSGRYPRGSGKDANQRRDTFSSAVRKLKKSGLSEKDIAEAKGMSIAKLRNTISSERTNQRHADVSDAIKLKDKGYSYSAISKAMGVSDHTVAGWLDPVIQKRADITENTANSLRDSVARLKYVDVGSGVENWMGVSRTKLNTAISMLEDDGHVLHNIYVEQGGVIGKYTEMKVLTQAGISTREVNMNRAQIKMPTDRTENGGETFAPKPLPVMLSSDRIAIRYKEDGGIDKDGIIEVRRGVDDLDMGKARYAQVRIGVDGTHYLKGVVMYGDNMPKGIDVIFNTNKKQGTPKEDVFKPIKKGPDDLEMDPDLPFGSKTIPKHYIDSEGKTKVSPLNIVYQEGDWSTWSTKLSSQFLSKQAPSLAKKQLDLSLEHKKAEFEDLVNLTNPAIKARLLAGDGGFADDCDSAAVHLKAAALPRSSSHVILPFPGMNENEIYAPGFDNGEKVVLVRHPHGGIFEIPELTVNNRYADAKKVIEGAKDAVGIHPKVAQKLSGADFDGDTVIVIPNKDRLVKTAPSLVGLKDFDPKELYQDKSLPEMTDRQKQTKMGEASNLITDMTIKGANPSGDEITRAIKYSMVVIDAKKHSLDYKKAASDYNISALREKYQGGKLSGASTLISKAGSDERVYERKLGITDPATGHRVYVDPATGSKLYRTTDAMYNKPVTKYKTLKDGTKVKVTVLLDGTSKQKSEMTPEDYKNIKTMPTYRMIKSTKMAEKQNALELSSGAPIENIYGRYANELKSLANKARLIGTKVEYKPYSPSAKKTYANEVESLKSKLNIAFKNKPLERKAQLLANNALLVKKQRDRNMTADTIKKLKGQQLEEYRLKTGAKKQRVTITDKEWEAIQTGAISKNLLFQILANADMDELKQRAMPRVTTSMSPNNVSRAKDMANNGFTRAEIATALGVSQTTLANSLK